MANRMERFTQRARQALSFAQEEAELHKSNHIGTEHLLLGLYRVSDGVAGRILRELKFSLEQARDLIPKAEIRSATTAPELTNGVKKTLESAVDEARRLGHHYIGTEHLLLGLARQPNEVGYQILDEMGVKADTIRQHVRRVLQEKPASPSEPASFDPESEDAEPNHSLRIAFVDKDSSETRFTLKFSRDEVASLLKIINWYFTSAGSAGERLNFDQRDYRVEAYIEDNDDETSD